MAQKDGWGLVLCGGGAKGAYQIGAWEALAAYGLFDKIQAISGVSIGAINEILMAGVSLETAKHIWNQIDFLTVFDTEPELIDMVEGTFSRNEMLDIMRQYLDYEKVTKSAYDLYVNITRIGTNVDDNERIAIYDTLNSKTQRQIEQLILASSALPLIYEAVPIDGYYYRDGGLTDNMPVKPLYEQGYRNIIVVSLSHKTVINTDLYPDAQILLIRPSRSLGDTFSGTLNFDRRKINIRRELGYRDTLRTLQVYFGDAAISSSGLQALADADYADILRSARQQDLSDHVNAHMDKLQSLINKYDI